MATFELEESDFAGYLDDGEIKNATVTKVKVVEKPYNDDDTGQPVKKVEFRFVIREPEGPFDGQMIKGETSTRFNSHPDCRLRNWANALMGMELPVGYRFDTDLVEGKDCRIVIGLKEYEDKKEPGKMKKYNFVSDVMPTPEAMRNMTVDKEPF